MYLTPNKALMTSMRVTKNSSYKGFFWYILITYLKLNKVKFNPRLTLQMKKVPHDLKARAEKKDRLVVSTQIWKGAW